MLRFIIITIFYFGYNKLKGDNMKNIRLRFLGLGLEQANITIYDRDNNLIYENDKDFDPESQISRQQFASVLYMYAKYKGYDVSVCEETNILSYDDFFDISEYAIAPMQYAAGSGIINGKTISTLNPKDSTTRAEVAVMLKRFIEK